MNILSTHNLTKTPQVFLCYLLPALRFQTQGRNNVYYLHGIARIAGNGLKQWVVFSLPRPYRFILNFSILRHLVEINCGTPSYAPLVVRQCSGFLFSTFLPDKILNRLFGIQYLTFAQTMLYNPSSSIPLKLMYRFGLEAASA